MRCSARGPAELSKVMRPPKRPVGAGQIGLARASLQAPAAVGTVRPRAAKSSPMARARTSPTTLQATRAASSCTRSKPPDEGALHSQRQLSSQARLAPYRYASRRARPSRLSELHARRAAPARCRCSSAAAHTCSRRRRQEAWPRPQSLAKSLNGHCSEVKSSSNKESKAVLRCSTH